MNIARLLSRAAAMWPENPALTLGAQEHATYRQLAADTAVRASNLVSRLGLHSGDRVALFMKNIPEYIEALYACWHAGLAAVPINAKLHPAELAYILEDSAAAACFVSSDLSDAAKSILDGLSSQPRLVVVGSPEWRALGEGSPIPIVEAARDDLAWLFYTSGTTGRPKGAMLTHGNLMSMTLGYFADVDSVAPGDCIIHAAPLSHGSGMYNFPHVMQGANQVMPESGQFDPAEVFDLIAVHCGVSFFAAPTMVKRLIEHPAAATANTGNLKTIIYGGGPMYVADLKRAMAVLGPKLAQIYGQGESPMTITALSKAQHERAASMGNDKRLASVGAVFGHIDVCVVDDTGHPVTSGGGAGEVCVRGDTVMKGYWGKPEATEEAVRDGWLHTGDVGCFDDDGFLTLMDRSKDVIISGGSNIYPREVEEVLLRHEGVAEVSVVGRAHPEWGEEVVAFVVTATGASVTEAELDALCLSAIARFKRPKTYRFIESLPKNNYGKILKIELRALLAAQNP
ncbi:MAG: AMP-binding protein [Rhodospirillales bacterium]|nr:AMP-binding protein [Rhodospirillales bacterium]